MGIVDGKSKPGDSGKLRAETRVLAVVSNCPQVRNHVRFNPTPIRAVIPMPPGRASGAAGRSAPDCRPVFLHARGAIFLLDRSPLPGARAGRLPGKVEGPVCDSRSWGGWSGS